MCYASVIVIGCELFIAVQLIHRAEKINIEECLKLFPLKDGEKQLDYFSGATLSCKDLIHYTEACIGLVRITIRIILANLSSLYFQSV